MFVVLLILPNIIFAFTFKGRQNRQVNNSLIIFEQIGRYGAMFFMIFNIPYTFWGFYFNHGQIIYIAFNSVLIFFYYLFWIIFWKKDCLTKSLLLSIIPSVIFLFSGIVISNIPLIIFSIIFSIFHIWISAET